MGEAIHLLYQEQAVAGCGSLSGQSDPMHAYLTRALQLAQKWRQTGMHAMRLYLQTLALVCQKVSNLVRNYAPIIRLQVRNIWQCTLKLSRIGFDHATLFTHR